MQAFCKFACPQCCARLKTSRIAVMGTCPRCGTRFPIPSPYTGATKPPALPGRLVSKSPPGPRPQPPVLATAFALGNGRLFVGLLCGLLFLLGALVLIVGLRRPSATDNQSAAGNHCSLPRAGASGGKNINLVSNKPPRIEPQKWALLIGVDDYAHVNKLRCCGQDVRGLRERLLAAGFGERRVFLLHDQATENKYRPFKENIEAQLDQLLGKVDSKGNLIEEGMVNKDDLVVIAFTGHGVLLDGASYLCPVETQLEKPETLVSLEGIYNRLLACRASQKLLLVDACRNDPRRSGQKSPQVTEATQGFAKSLEKPREGILVLASCKPGEVSWEDKDLGNGVFMHFILTALAGGATDKDGEVTALGLYKYASKETKLHVARMYSQVQTPQLYYGSEDDFVIGSAVPPLPPPVPSRPEPIPEKTEPLAPVSPLNDSPTKAELLGKWKYVGATYEFHADGSYSFLIDGSPQILPGQDLRVWGRYSYEGGTLKLETGLGADSSRVVWISKPKVIRVGLGVWNRLP
jgi:hypothetical protein